MSRFNYFDPNNTVERMGKGNPGAITAMITLYESSASVEDDKIVLNKEHGQWPWEMVKICDELGIYGSRLYMLWSDCLKKDVHKMAVLAKLYREGKVTGATILEHIQGDGIYGKPFDDIDWDVSLEETDTDTSVETIGIYGFGSVN